MIHPRSCVAPTLVSSLFPSGTGPQPFLDSHDLSFRKIPGQLFCRLSIWACLGLPDVSSQLHEYYAPMAGTI